MSNPNTNALISLLRNTTNDTTITTATSYKIIFLSQDYIPVSILIITPFTEHIWKTVLALIV